MSKRYSLDGYTHDKVSKQLVEIVQEMMDGEMKFSGLLNELHTNFKQSGYNLIHYLVLRSNEIRDAQEYLHHIGLSSLTNSESHTLFQLQNVLSWLDPDHHTLETGCNFEMASKLRSAHAEQLLGVFPIQDRPHIMVTFSSELMQDRMLVEEMLNEGMSVARINCAHDNPDVWLNMIHVLKKAVAKTGRNCKVYMDLGGPKIRIRSIAARKKNQQAQLPVSEGSDLYLQFAGDQEGSTRDSHHRKNLDVLNVEPKEILLQVSPGEHIYFDDGKFEAKVMEVSPDRVRVKIVRISTKKPFLKPEKGINLPDSDLGIPPLTEEDNRNIPFICEHADMVGYSFVNAPSDVEVLRSEINKYSVHKRPAIILKIERLSAVQNLPALLMNGMKDEALGVMIARGDLAVEIGFERLSEIQEEILWICEAAHVPVIWATQVLETLNKTGYATRSEITDAAMGVRAECVMLNKGKFIVKTIKTLDDILTRQLGHVNKKRYIMRPLGIARNFLQD